MNVRGPQAAALDELERGLAAARRRLHRARVKAAGLRAIPPGLGLLAALAALGLAARSACWWAGVDPGGLWGVYAGAVPAALVLVAGAHLVPVLLRPVTPAAAAERLDLATANHNRIATAVDLAGRGDASPFAAAAIQDGLDHLRRLQDRSPYVEPPVLRWRRVAGLLAAALLLNAAMLVPGPPAPAAVPPGPSADVPRDADRPAALPGAMQEREPRETPPRPHVARAATSSAPPNRQAGPAIRPPGARPTEPAAGAGGEGRAAAAPLAREAMGAGAAAGAAGGSAAVRGGAARPGRSRALAPPAAVPGRAPPPLAESAAISAGTAGGGAASPVTHEWLQREAAGEDERAEPEAEEPDEQQRGSGQRGGLQPSLKDRQESPSRELGLSGPQDGPPGSGRGGPTPPKKARGTASLVLGVPVPDFVKGRLGPGATKVVQERVAPTPLAAERGVTSAAAERAVPEAAVQRFEAPPELAAAIRAYLVALHAALERAPAGAPAGTDREASTRSEREP